MGPSNREGRPPSDVENGDGTRRSAETCFAVGRSMGKQVALSLAALRPQERLGHRGERLPCGMKSHVRKARRAV